MAQWTRRVGFLAFVSALIAGFTAWILYETDQTSRLRDRAFVYFSNPPAFPYPEKDPVVWGVGISVFNAGNMPARRVSIRYDCPYVPRSERVIDPYSRAKWQSAEIGSVLGPKNGASLQACNVPINVIEAAKKSEMDVFAVFEVRYIDGFYLGTERVTQMSRIFRFDQWGGQSLGFAGPHNCSDEDCPK